MIYKAMRPNMTEKLDGSIKLGLGMHIAQREKTGQWAEVVEKFGAKEKIENRKVKTEGKERGNTGIYVCPYINCHHISDADLQAALNIAIRGYIKSRPDNKITKAEDFIVFAKDLDYDPVELLR